MVYLWLTIVKSMVDDATFGFETGGNRKRLLLLLCTLGMGPIKVDRSDKVVEDVNTDKSKNTYDW